MPSLPTPIPSTQTAILQLPDGHLTKSSKPVPTLTSPTDVLIAVHTVALNPTDFKMPLLAPATGATSGCDFAGRVVAFGPGHSPTTDTTTVSFSSPPATAPSPPRLKLGDRVCGAVHGSNPTDHSSGAFAEYLVADARLVLKVPAEMSWERAAAVGGIGWGTLGLALWESLGLRKGRLLKKQEGVKEQAGVPVLVYGASTATGTMAVQLLRLAGYTPIATCSPASFDLVRSYGVPAAHILDYTSPTLTTSIKFLSSASLKYALDCITDAESVRACYASLSRTGGRYASLELPKPEWITRQAIKSEFVMGYEIFGKEIVLPGGYARKADLGKSERAKEWCSEVEDLLEKGLIRNHPVELVEGVWNGILQGLGRLKRGEVRGVKLVTHVAES